MSRLAKRFADFSLILLAFGACDNVEWGGIDIRVESTASEDSIPGDGAEAEPEGPTGPVLPDGPILFAASPGTGNRMTLRPVGAVRTDTVVGFPSEEAAPGFTELLVSERMAPGSRFTLFAEGTRVGSVTVDSIGSRPGRCGPVPVASGIVELIPDAMGAERFVALPQGVGLPRTHEPYGPQEHTYDQRVAGLGLASEAITRSGAAWPGSVLDTRADFQAVPLDGDRTGAIAGTFLFQDALRVGPSLTRAAYSIFLLGTGGPASYDMAFMSYRPVANGKAAMRYFEQADWDEDGETELLVEVFGEEARWFMALDRRGGSWTRIHEPVCAATAGGA